MRSIGPISGGRSAARQREARFRADLLIRVTLRQCLKFHERHIRHLARPRRLACDAAQRVCSIAPDARYGIIQDGHERLEGPVIRKVIEQLYAPPTDLRVRIGKSFDQGVRCILGGERVPQFGRSQSADQRADGCESTIGVGKERDQRRFVHD